MLQVTPHLRTSEWRRRHCVIDLSPDLFDALTELAAVEGLPLGTLVVLLINSGFSERLTRLPRWR